MAGKEVRVHAPVHGFETRNGSLAIDGVAIERLAERAGGTPFYAYSRTLMDERVKRLRKALPEKVEIHYAIKANPMPAVVQHFAGLVDGFDIASAGELAVVLDTPMPVSEISFAGPGKRDAELVQAIAAGVTVNLESAGELERTHGVGERLGIRPRVAVRVNPDFKLTSAGMQMSGGAKPFGIDAEAVPQLLGRIGALDLDFRGFHIFSGSQNLRAEVLIEAQAKTVDLAVALAKHAPSPVRMLNIGGGFGIPYFPGETHLDIETIGARLGESMPKVAAAMPEAAVILELGRYLVGEAGIYVCRVVDRKESHGQTFLVADGGMHHHLALSGNFGQAFRKNYPVAIGNKMDRPAEETVEIVGPLCTPLDKLGEKMALPRAEPGDFVVVFQSGAYGPTASPVGFLSHPLPREILV